MVISGAALIFAGASASASVATALANNEQVEKSQAAEAEQIKTKARFENRQLARSLEKYSQSLRVSAATRGAEGMSTAALTQGAVLQTLEQARTMRKNKFNALQASVSQANSQLQSPVLRGIIGGLQGLSAGSALFPGVETLTTVPGNFFTHPGMPGVSIPLP